jgi:hypothetical protein
MEIETSSTTIHFLNLFEKIFTSTSVIVAALSVSILIISAIRAGAIKELRLGAISIQGAKIERDAEKSFATERSTSTTFEIQALENYYNQALSRANISFWFSLIFASIGFGVIILAFVMHSKDDILSTAIKVASGTVIDAVSALFFYQSTAAQKSMSEFFEKLRLDRLNAEARDMVGQVENVERRDQLRAQLVLKYSGIDKLLSGA